LNILNIFRERGLPAALLAVCFAFPCAALDPNRSIDQYIHEQWRTGQGFAGGDVHAFANTPDGYFWIGAEKGLVRFDGRSFHLFDHSNTPSIPRNLVLGLLTDREGSLWVRLQTPHLLRLRNGVFQEMFPDAVPETGVTVMGVGNNGDVLLVRPGHVIRFSNEKPLELTQAIGGTSTSIVETPNGTVWIGKRDEGLLALRDGKLSVVPELPDRKVNCLLRGSGDELWIGTDHGLVRWNGKEITLSGVPPDLRRGEVLALMRDRDSNVWAGTNTGLFRIDPEGRLSSNRSSKHLPKPVSALFEDREGSVWFGGPDGLERYRDSVFLSRGFDSDEEPEDSGPLYADDTGRTWYGPAGGGLSWFKDSEHGSIGAVGKDVVYSLAGGQGELWVGRQRGGLTQLSEDGSNAGRTYTSADGLASGSIYVVDRTRDGTIWAGTPNGGVSRVRNGKITTYTTANGLLSNSVSAIQEGIDGTVWLATANGLQSFANEKWSVYSSPDGMPPERVNCLAADSGGVLWMGTDAGLAFIRGGRLQIPSDMPDALLEPVLGIAQDRRGDLWIATSGHVVRASRANLLGDVAGRGNIRVFGPADGIPVTEGVRRNRSVVNDRLGRIWFSLHGGISVVDPARAVEESPPAIVHIEVVSAAGHPLDISAALRIRAAQQRITFGFIGLSLAVPDRVRYRYRLDGFDHDWSEPGASEEAAYTNLAPGPYRFHVIASNSEGLWNSTEATIALEIIPAIWQTWWFIALTVVACAIGVFFVHRFRVRRLTATLNRAFEERLAERTRIAQILHDTLLQGFLSASMQVNVAVDRLPEDSGVKPGLTRALEIMRQVIDEGRNAVRGLRASDEAAQDLERAFSKIHEETTFQKQSRKPDFRVVVEGERRALHPVLRDEVYRIGREALINAFRHAKAKTVEVEIEYAPNRLRVVVRDDGCGIEPDVLETGRDGHWGLVGMRERASRIGAQLQVSSSASEGTLIEVSVPGSVAFQKRSSRKASASE